MVHTPTSPSSSTLYIRLLRYALAYKGYFLLSIIGFLLFAGMEALLVRTLEFFINALEGEPTTSIQFLPQSFISSIFFVPTLIVVLSIFRGIGTFLGNYYMSCLGLGVVNDLRKQVFNHMVYLPQQFYDNKNSGELVSLIIYNIEQVTGSVTGATKILLRDGLTLLAFLFLLFYLNWKLTLILFVVAPILAGLVYLAGRYFRRVSRKIQLAVGRITHITTETFQGIKLVKSYVSERYEKDRFTQAADENLKYGVKFERVNALQAPVMHIIIALALAVIFFLVLLIWPAGSEAQAVVYVSAAGLIAKPFRQLNSVNAIIQRGIAASETIFSAIDLPLEPSTGTKQLDNVNGTVVFDHVKFGYDELHTAIEDVSFTIEPGETVALVGRSGSGKTSLANLLLRFYEIDSGEITIDGISIADLSLDNLRANIALVNQQTVLFNDTVLANIAYGEKPSDINQEAVHRAAENAYANTFIAELENAYDTPVGEDGTRLSGGQRQRIAIARALYKNAPILILDEATSALDNESEKQIQNALDKLTQNRSTLIIAHRLSTIENADKIIVLENGRVVEMGDHPTLLAKGGAYTNLHNNELS